MTRSHTCSLHLPPEKLTGAFACDEKCEKRKKEERGQGTRRQVHSKEENTERKTKKSEITGSRTGN